MEVKAVAKYLRVQPRKVRIIADEVRGKNAVHVSGLLRYHPSKGARLLGKVLQSAMANAVENHGLSAETLKVSTIMVDEGPSLKRIIARAQGRANRILKKTSHITVVVEDAEPTAIVRAHGTKAKSRPKFAAPEKKGKKKEAPVAEETPVETPVEEAEVQEAGSTEEAQPEKGDE